MINRKNLEKIFFRLDKIALSKDYVYEYYKIIDELIEGGQYNDFKEALLYYYSIDVDKWNNITDMKKNTWELIVFQTNTPTSKKLKKLYDNKQVYQMGYDFYSDSLSTLTFDISSNSITSTYSIALELDNNVFLSTDNPYTYQFDLFSAKWDNSTPVLSSLRLLQRINGVNYGDMYQTEIAVSQGGEYLIRAFNILNYLEIIDFKVIVSRNTYLGQIIEREDYTLPPEYYVQNLELAQIKGDRKVYLEAVKGTQSTYITTDYPNLSIEQNYINRYRLAIEYLLNII